MSKISFISTPVSAESFSEQLHLIHTDLLDAQDPVSRRQALSTLQQVIGAALATSLFSGKSLDAAGEDQPSSNQLHFDGTTSHIVIPSLLYSGHQPITVEAVVHPKSITGERTIIGNHHGNGLSLRMNNGYWEFVIHNGKKYVRSRSDEKITPEVPVHLTGICDGHSVRLYIDQQPQKQFSAWSGKHKASPLPLMIGADPDSEGQAQHHFEGSIHTIRISGVARDRVPIWKKVPFGKPDKFDAVYFDMHNIKDGTIHDRSSWKHHGKLHEVSVKAIQ